MIGVIMDLFTRQFSQVKRDHHTTREHLIHDDPDTLIVCSGAMSPEGLVIASLRHGDDLFYNAVGDISCMDWIQGFITNQYVFVTREEAWIIAERQGQIRNQLPCDHTRRLYSENLY